DTLSDNLKIWEYRKYTTTQAATFKEASIEAAGDRSELAKGIRDLNKDILTGLLRVPKGSVLQIPGTDPYKAKEDTTVGAVAKDMLKEPRLAQAIFTLNESVLAPGKKVKPSEIPTTKVPKDAELSLPKTYTAEIEGTLSEVSEHAKVDKAATLFNLNKE